jgi:hypothetical protein
MLEWQSIQYRLQSIHAQCVVGAFDRIGVLRHPFIGVSHLDQRLLGTLAVIRLRNRSQFFGS